MWYLDYHWQLRWDNQGSCGSKSLHVWLRRAQTHTLYESEQAKLAQCLPLHKHLRMRLHIQNCVTNVTNSLPLFSFLRCFSASMAKHRILSLIEIYVSTCHMFPWTQGRSWAWLSQDFFPHWGFPFLQAHWFANRGGEWSEPSIYISFK